MRVRFRNTVANARPRVGRALMYAGFLYGRVTVVMRVFGELREPATSPSGFFADRNQAIVPGRAHTFGDGAGATMADAGASCDVAKAIGDPLGMLIGWLAGMLPEGPARTALLVLVGLCVAVAPFIYKYYLGVLAQGAAPD